MKQSALCSCSAIGRVFWLFCVPAVAAALETLMYSHIYCPAAAAAASSSFSGNNINTPLVVLNVVCGRW